MSRADSLGGWIHVLLECSVEKHFILRYATKINESRLLVQASITDQSLVSKFPNMTCVGIRSRAFIHRSHSPFTAWVNSWKGLNGAEAAEQGVAVIHNAEHSPSGRKWVSRVSRCIDPFIHSFYTLSISACGNTAAPKSNMLFYQFRN